MQARTLWLVVPVVIAVPLWASPAPHAAGAKSGLTPQQIVDARRAGMRLSSADILTLRMAGEKGAELRRLSGAATALSQWGGVIPTLFPPGTGADAAQTNALPEIWSNRADFEQRARDFSTAAASLAEALNAGDMTTAGAQWDATWAGCNGCHQRYRRPMPPAAPAAPSPSPS